MNWMENMNNALNYIEENIEKVITADEISAVACSSKFHFIRIFNVLTGMTLGEYIRQRKLSLAAKDVMSSSNKIIDIAYKYGYETPEAFTKAFKRLHHISPSQARKKGVKLKAIPPISFQITVKGEERMDYKLVEKESFKVVGLTKRIMTRNGENFKLIPKFWDEVYEAGNYVKMEKQQKELGILGVCYDCDISEDSFEYMIGVQGENLKDIDNYKVCEVPKHTYAIFQSVGPMPESLQNVWKRIFSEFFPATKYEMAPAPQLEVYLPGDPNSEDYKCEVWIPIIVQK